MQQIIDRVRTPPRVNLWLYFAAAFWFNLAVFSFSTVLSLRAIEVTSRAW
jgi:hypothetical protein